MAKPFQKWPKEIPEVGRKVQVIGERREICESTVIKRGTSNGKLYYIILEDGTYLQIDPIESLKKMEIEKTDNGPLWSISVKNGSGPFDSNLETANLFVLD